MTKAETRELQHPHNVVLLAMIEERNAIARRIDSLTACVTSAKFADLPDHDLISTHLHWLVGLHAVLVSRILRLSEAQQEVIS